jgi:hypothetical protein
MQPASSAITLAASPSALTLQSLRVALAAESVYRAACLAAAPTRLAANAARDAALEYKRRKSLALASAAAEALADETAAALGYEEKGHAATAALGELIRALYADRVRALGDGPLWTGCGYADVLADAVADPARDGGYHGSFNLLGETPAVGVVDALMNWDAWNGEVTSICLRAHLPSTRRDGSACVDLFDALRVRFPEPRFFGDKARRDVEVGLTGTSLGRAALPAYGTLVDAAQALVTLADRYAVAYPERTPREDAAALILNGGEWRLQSDGPEVISRRLDPRA